jgi:putative FmdB family regulatory protein
LSINIETIGGISMPVYEYKCMNCGVEYSFLKLRAEDDPRCPGCGSEDAEKKISGFSCPAVEGSNSGSGGC